MQTSTHSINKSMEFDTVETFPFELLKYIQPCKGANGHPKFHNRKYADIIATFDIETTNLPELKQSVMWHWQVCVDGMVCIGRTWDEYKKFLKGVDENLQPGLCFVQYVHNLGFE